MRPVHTHPPLFRLETIRLNIPLAGTCDGRPATRRRGPPLSGPFAAAHRGFAWERSASRPVSRVLWGGLFGPRDGHSSWAPVAGRLTQPTRATGLETGRVSPRRPYSVLLPVGFTVPVPLPVPRWALTPPFHPYPRTGRGRFAFCGTFPGVAPAGRYPAPCFRGARTFLPDSLSAVVGAAVRPTGNPDKGIRAPKVKAVRINGQASSISPATSGSASMRRFKVRTVEASATPSIRAGRKCRWNARTTASVASSKAPLAATS